MINYGFLVSRNKQFAHGLKLDDSCSVLHEYFKRNN